VTRPASVSARDRRDGVVEVVGLTKRFGDVTAVEDVSFRLEPGTFFALLGPSGCGKTTLLRMLAGFEQPTAGQIFINDEPVAGVPPYRRRVNTVFQHYALFPHMDVAANVAYGPSNQHPRPGRGELDRMVTEVLDLVRLTGYERRRAWELSGGQQQRVALARALVNRPTVLLLDEPLGALDLKLRREMQGELKRLQEQVGITFIFVTHDQNEAFSMADRVAVMRDGTILQDGAPAVLYDQPVDSWVASFIGQMNFFAGDVVESGITGAVRLPNGTVLRGLMTAEPIPAGQPALVAIRPERVSIGLPDAAGGPTDGDVARFTGRLAGSVFLGDQVEHTVEAAAIGSVLVRVPNVVQAGGVLPGTGEEVQLSWTHDMARIVVDRRRAGTFGRRTDPRDR
jgi:spermidine/putrescine transport system ATP-binding protein